MIHRLVVNGSGDKPDSLATNYCWFDTVSVSVCRLSMLGGLLLSGGDLIRTAAAALCGSLQPFWTWKETGSLVAILQCYY